jgi:hypothetical protein
VTAIKPALCGVCRRQVPLRRDGRLRPHLAATSRPGHRQQCDGSGGYSARLKFLEGTEPQPPEHQAISAPAAFNAREEWAKADALYYEWRDMTELGAAGPDAIEAARQATERALATLNSSRPGTPCHRTRPKVKPHDAAPSAAEKPTGGRDHSVTFRLAARRSSASLSPG